MNALGIPNQTAGEAAFSLFIFSLGLIVSVGFAYLLVADASRLVDLWAWIRSLPIIIQIGMWLLLLPWMAALWVFATPWALPIRLVLVVGILAFTDWLIFPWKA